MFQEYAPKVRNLSRVKLLIELAIIAGVLVIAYGNAHGQSRGRPTNPSTHNPQPPPPAQPAITPLPRSPDLGGQVARPMDPVAAPTVKAATIEGAITPTEPDTSFNRGVIAPDRAIEAVGAGPSPPLEPPSDGGGDSTPTPTPTPDPTPEISPSPSPTEEPTPDPSPSPSEELETATPSPSVSASPTPATSDSPVDESSGGSWLLFLGVLAVAGLFIGIGARAWKNS